MSNWQCWSLPVSSLLRPWAKEHRKLLILFTMLKVKLLTNTLEVCSLLSKADHIKSTVFGILLPESVKLLLKWINLKTTLYNLIKATEFSSQRNKLNARQVEIYSCTSGTFTLTTCSFLMCLQNCKQNFFTID